MRGASITQATLVDNLQSDVYNLAMKVTALGEFGLITALRRMVERSSPGLVVGIGDDAAVWKASSTQEIATTDLLLEGIHFTLDTATWYEVGWKALSVNLSDIAAMGGEPRYALVALALPPSADVAHVAELYHGASDLCDRYGVVIAGGDTVRSPQPVVVSVTAVGAARAFDGKVRLLRRDTAQVGDIVGVTGTLGGSAGGLELLLQRKGMPGEVAEALRAMHLRPVPRVPEAQVLLAAGVGTAMDISDGLVGDLGKLCQASNVAAILDPAKLPVHPALDAAFPGRGEELALYGGEDYELLFCTEREIFATVSERLREMGLTQATAVGEIVAGPAGKVWLLGEDGKKNEPRAGGYDAFGD